MENRKFRLPVFLFDSIKKIKASENIKATAYYVWFGVSCLLGYPTGFNVVNPFPYDIYK